MSYDTANYEDVEATSSAMHFMRDALDCERVGLTVVECEPGWEGMTHDHADDDHEEVYLLLEGEATVRVDGDDVSLEPGDAIRIDPESERQIRNGDAESRLVLVGAP